MNDPLPHKVVREKRHFWEAGKTVRETLSEHETAEAAREAARQLRDKKGVLVVSPKE